MLSYMNELVCVKHCSVSFLVAFTVLYWKEGYNTGQKITECTYTGLISFYSISFSKNLLC